MTNQRIMDALKSSGYYMTDGHFRLISGKHSDAYIQARLCLMDPKIRHLFVEEALPLAREAKPSHLAAFTIGGLLFARALGERLSLPVIVGRMAAKGVEWVNADLLTANTQLLLVDDIITTASQLNQATASLENTPLGTIVAALVAVDRTTAVTDVVFRHERVLVQRCVEIPLPLYDPSSCPLCRVGVPPKDLSNPEKDVISVVLSQPSDKSDFILKGYEEVYQMQGEARFIEEIHAWKPWLPVLSAGLPMARMEEDSRLITFVRHLTSLAQDCDIDIRVLSEIVGQLVSLSCVRVESRALGCSLLVSDPNEIGKVLTLKARAKLPMGVSYNKLTDLVPYFDAFLETAYTIVLDKHGNVVDLRRLVCSLPKIKQEGIELLRHITSRRTSKSIAFVLRRGRSDLSVYWNGRLEAVGELSERTGLWEFARPMERLDEINRIIPGIEDILITVVETARELVAKGCGGLFVVGDTKGLKYTTPKVEIDPQPIEDLSIQDIVELSKLDGAVMIDKKGQLQCVTVIIQNKEEVVIQNKEETATATEGRPTHGGSRKETARRTSLECPDAAVVYVSQNGAIEVYVKGHSWAVTQSMSGLPKM